jgi:WD40 repeat protein
LLAVGSLGDVRLFGVPNWEPRGVMPVAERNSDVHVVALSADGSLLAAGQGERILLFDALKAIPLSELSQRAAALAFTPDDQRLISGGEDGLVHVHDVKQAR